MTDQKAAAVARPESCTAKLDGEYPTCERCGLAWHRDTVPVPPCKPMNVKALRLVLLSEAAALTGSHNAIVKMMRDDDAPADPVDALKRATALRGVLLFVERCGDSEVIVHELQRIARQAAIDAKPDEADAE